MSRLHQGTPSRTASRPWPITRQPRRALNLAEQVWEDLYRSPRRPHHCSGPLPCAPSPPTLLRRKAHGKQKWKQWTSAQGGGRRWTKRSQPGGEVKATDLGAGLLGPSLPLPHTVDPLCTGGLGQVISAP